MIPRALILVLATSIAGWFGSADVLAAPSAFASQASHSPLDPVRLAADFAPRSPAAPEVTPFELAADAAATSLVDSLSPAALPQQGEAGPPLVPLAGAPVEPPPTVVPVLGALIGGAVGLYAGGALGLAIVDHDNDNAWGDEWVDITGILLGAAVGEVFLMPAGAHLFNESRGSYWSALGGSALGFVATLGLSFLGPAGTIAGVVLQTALTVSGERRSARHKAAERVSTSEQAEPTAP